MFRSVLTVGELRSGFVRATAPPRNVAESARCPQAFSRPQDSHSSSTIDHYQNSSSWLARHVFSTMQKLIQYLIVDKKIYLELPIPATYQHNLRKYLHVPPNGSISTRMSQSIYARPLCLDLYHTLAPQTNLTSPGPQYCTSPEVTSVTVCSLQ